ncbi:hypothetical protein CsSME_00027580 [Camellia sinensis var. sinensis]
MKLHHHHCRHFATKYNGRVVVEAYKGCSFAVEIDSPTIQIETKGYTLPHHDLICKITKILSFSTITTTTFDHFFELSDYLQTLTLTPFEASEILKSLNSPTLNLDLF